MTPAAIGLMENIACPAAVLERGERGKVWFGIPIFFILLEDLDF